MELGPVQGGKKSTQEKKKASLKLHCCIHVGSAMLIYGGALNLNPKSVQFPPKVEEILGYRRSKGKGEWNMGSRMQSSTSFTFHPLGAGMKIAIV